MAASPPALTRRLDDATADRLVKVLGMLGSAHAGERASAALKADTIVRSAGMTWADVVMPSPPTAPQLPDHPSNWRSMAFECHSRRAWLKPAERDFIGKLLNWRGEPSERQLSWLVDIHSRVLDAEGRP